MSGPTDTYFGLPDAAHEDADHILSNHVLKTFEASLKCGEKAHGKQIIVGIKGSGKTDLRRYLERRDRIPTWNIDVDHAYLSIDPGSLKGRSGVLKNTLSFELLRAIADRIASQPEAFDLPKQEKRLKDRLSRVTEILKNIPQAVDVTTPIGHIRLSELLKSRASSFLTTATATLIDGLLETLSGKRIFVMIDDADDVFQGLEANPIFIEGLARAIEEINRLAGAHIHALLFLKYGVWRLWYEHQQEYDKVKHVIQELSWTDSALRELIARRIARIRGIQLGAGTPLDVEGLWAKEFEWPGMTFDGFVERFTRLCMGGPRDMIELANASKATAGARKIASADLDAVTAQYSENKLYGIGADFGGVYEDIAQFIGLVFHGCPVLMEGHAASSWVEKHGLTVERVDAHFKRHRWYSSAGPDRLVAIMYEVGLLGRVRDDGTVEYAIQRPVVSTSELLGSRLYVHPALQPHLGVGGGNQQTSKTGSKRRDNSPGAHSGGGPRTASSRQRHSGRRPKSR